MAVSVLELILSKYPHTGTETKYTQCSTRLGFIFILKDLKLILNQPFSQPVSGAFPTVWPCLRTRTCCAWPTARARRSAACGLVSSRTPPRMSPEPKSPTTKIWEEFTPSQRKVFHSFQITRSFYLPTSNTYVLFSNVSFSANESLSRKSIEVQKPIYEN